MDKKFPFYKQLDQKDCGPTCLRMIAKYHGKIYSREYLREKSSLTRSGVSLAGIAEAAEAIGLSTLGVTVPIDKLVKEVPLPCIAHWNQKHFVVVYRIKKNKFYVADPAYGLITYSKEEFLKGWRNKKVTEDTEGVLLLVEATPEFYESGDFQITNKKNFKFLIPYFKPYKKIFFQLFLGLFIGSILQLAFPFLTQSIIDKGINFQNRNFIVLVLIAQLTLFLSDLSVQSIRGWLLLHITSRINIRLISDFLIKLMRLPISFFDSNNLGDLMQRIQDHNRIENFLSAVSLNVLFSAVNLIVFGCVLFYYNTMIFFVFFLGALLYLFWSLIFLKKRAEIDFKSFDQASNSQNSIIELLSGMQEIKLNGSERRRRWEWEVIQLKLFKLSLTGLSLTQTQDIGGRFINELKNILITFIAANTVISGDMTLGMMLSVQYIIGQLNLPINNIIVFVRSGQDAKLSLERLTQIHNKKNEQDYEKNYVNDLPDDKSIIISNLSFKYGGKSSPLVLDNLTVTIPHGKVTAIVGASGSGKTTLIKLLLKFYDVNSTSISISSTSLNNIDPNLWRKHCGSVMQDGFIFSDSIARNITESDSEGLIDKEKLVSAVDVANITEFIESLPLGYNSRIGSTGFNISGGQRQRILIARAVYKNPDYLFFDEATSALDANNEKVIMENLNRFFKNKTVIIVAHRLSTVRNADNIIVLDKGKVIEEGTHASLTENRGAYYTLVKNQLELGE